MPDVFGSGYADAYDLIYEDKDYESECDAIERTIGRYSVDPSKSVLDLGCGTGGHSLRLASRGYGVVGVDRSKPMLEIARSKVGPDQSITFVSGDIKSVQVDASFDVALFMFAVLGYQIENSDVLAALANARKHLRPEGLLVADLWYGPAVLAQQPAERTREIKSGENTIYRTSSGEIDLFRQVCRVDMNVRRVKNGDLLSEVHESHEVRFFFPRELELLLSGAGFRLLRLGAFPRFEDEANEATWNVMIVARASRSAPP